MEINLVSVIIPCFNAERWIGEAIDSCLRQTYPHLQIIVIDDGSTDRSLEIIQSFSGSITWETGVNRGGNHARNRGFALAQGNYIQYLDGDDYFLPHKIARQIRFLTQHQVDMVYGDVIYQYHLPAGVISQQNAEFPGIAGSHEDFLESLLAYGCLPPMAYLLRREAIVHNPGWDETLPAAQDRDFFISLMLSNPHLLVKYQPSYDSVYRRYGNVTVSTASKPRLVKSFCRVLAKAEFSLQSRDLLSRRYIKALATSYYNLSETYRQDISFSLYQYMIKKYLALMGRFWFKKLEPLALVPVQLINS